MGSGGSTAPHGRTQRTRVLVCKGQKKTLQGHTRYTKDARSEVDNLRGPLHLVVLVVLQYAFLPTVVPTEMVPPLHHAPQELPLFSGAQGKGKHEQRGWVLAGSAEVTRGGVRHIRRRSITGPKPGRLHAPTRPRRALCLQGACLWAFGAKGRGRARAAGHGKRQGICAAWTPIFPRGPAAARARIHATAQRCAPGLGLSGRLGTNEPHAALAVGELVVNDERRHIAVGGADVRVGTALPPLPPLYALPALPWAAAVESSKAGVRPNFQLIQIIQIQWYRMEVGQRLQTIFSLS
jgi:hypothetical protein